MRLPTRLVASLSVLALTSSPGSASSPSRANSTFPTDGICLVGTNSASEVDASGEFSVTVRHASNLPIQGSTVTVNFNACTPDIVVSSLQPFPGMSVVCNGARGVVSGQTNNLGVATFRIAGGGAGTSSGTLTACAEIRANNVYFSTVRVALLDQVGALDGANPNDLAVAITDINSGADLARDDLDYDGHSRPNDLANMIHRVNAGGSAHNTGAICP